MTARRHTLPKKSILRGKRVFEYIFEHGSSIRVGVLKFVYCTEVPNELVESPITAGFSAPKRLLRRAVDRNYIKRRLRESYRLNQELLAPPADKHSSLPLVFFVIYQRNRTLPYAAIQKDMVKGLRKLRSIAYGDH